MNGLHVPSLLNAYKSSFKRGAYVICRSLVVRSPIIVSVLPFYTQFVYIDVPIECNIVLIVVV
jgi:hypothetical protein